MKTNRKVLYWAIVYCVIIGIIYVTLSVLALFTRWCKMNHKASTFIYMLYLQFFRVDKCEEKIDWDFLNGDDNNEEGTTVALKVNDFIVNDTSANWTSETSTVKRTYVFSMSYLTLHAALIVVSIIALCGILVSYIGKKSFILIIASWLSILISIIILDALATVYYIIDSSSVWKVDGLYELLEIPTENNDKSFGNISFFSRIGPAIIMTLATSKVFLIWIFNAYVCVLIAKYGWSLANEKREKDKENYQNAIMANDNPAFEDENSHKAQINPLSRPIEITQEAIVEEVPANQTIENNILEQEAEVVEAVETVETVEAEPPIERYQDTSRSVNVYPHPLYAKSKKQKQVPEEDLINFKIQRPKLDVNSNRSPASSPNYQKYVDNQIENRLSRFQASNGNLFAYENVPKNRENHYAKINVQQQKEVKSRPYSTAKPMNNQNKFYLQDTGHEEQSIQYRTDNRSNYIKVDRSSSNLKAPEVLKSQLPWSYFKPSENAPRKTLMHEEQPEYPRPDYYSNSPVKMHKHYDGSDFEESWKYQRY